MLMRRIVLLLLYLMPFATHAQQAVGVSAQEDQHIFTFQEIQWLEDGRQPRTLEQILALPDTAFKASSTSTPGNSKPNVYYWYRIKIRRNPGLDKQYILEFFDQTIDDLQAFLPDSNNQYHLVQLGDAYPFSQRTFRHKNFELKLDNSYPGESVYYFRVRSAQTADMIVVLRSINKFIAYALTEYITFGLFYGMILIFCFYNLIMFITMRQRQYLWYILYIISVAFFEMSTDGIAYQYIWPDAPRWNQYAYAVPLCCMSVFALAFTRSLLYVRARASRLNKLIIGVIIARIAFFLACLVFNRYWFNYKFIEIVPLALAFYSGIYIYRTGYRAARFFVLGYSFLFAGFMLKFFIMLGYSWLNFGAVSYYSLSFCFILEMFFLSFAIGDKLRLLKKKKEKAQQEIIRQMTANARLKDSINQQLEQQVKERTQELVEKNHLIEAQNQELLSQNSLIEAQNQELNDANQLLTLQSEEILRMNTLLEEDNQQLLHNVEKVSRARVLSAPVDFEEFSRTYPDNESCFRFLAELKWQQGYHCYKCGHEHYFAGHAPFSRRCSRCSYEESVLANTIFQNTRIPINKAFYIVFLVYTSKGKISSHKLSELLDIRQSTCWSYQHKVKSVMEERKKELKTADAGGWSKLVL